ncbi:hypothetical protein SH528x_003862 [Novipirellula sp. SH528]|uniref:hypothetical protein n=1 Tax=Novipirellula sp. SH528 TaxID=3454466 RepID=UPI003F9FDF9C
MLANSLPELFITTKEKHHFRVDRMIVEQPKAVKDDARTLQNGGTLVLGDQPSEEVQFGYKSVDFGLSVLGDERRCSNIWYRAIVFVSNIRVI